MKTAIFVTTQDYWEYADLTCRTVEAYAPEGTELHLVDDHSTCPHTISWTHDLKQKGAWRVWEHETEAKGLTFGWNEAIQYCLDRPYLDYLGIFNNDIALGPNFVEDMLAAFEADPLIGIVGPMSNQPGHQPQQDIRELLPWVTFEQMNDFMGVNGFCYWLKGRLESKKSSPVRYLPYTNGFCYFLRADTVREIGLFNPDNRNFGNEDEYQKRMKAAGLKSACVESAFVWHAKRVTLGGVNAHAGRVLPRLGEADIVT